MKAQATPPEILMPKKSPAPQPKALNPEEQAALDRLKDAVSALPPSLCLQADDFFFPGQLIVWKPSRHGCHAKVASIPCSTIC